MANRFEEVLDECIDRLTRRGESIQQCLERYPEHADNLEAELRLAQRLALITDGYPSPAAKERGRQSLRAEIAALKEQGRPKKKKGPRLFAFPLCFASQRIPWVAALSALVLLVIISAVSLLMAAESAMPGNPLYRVKRANEQVRLALTPSDDDRAELHLAFAGRRSDEIIYLIRKGEVQQLDQVRRDLVENLNEAASTISYLTDRARVDKLLLWLETSSLQSLYNIQSVLQEVAEVSETGQEQPLFGIFQSFSEAYGGTIETLLQRFTRVPDLAKNSGTLQLWVSDPPAPDLDAALVEVDKIEAFRPALKDNPWITITEEPATFDLLQVSKVQKFLAEQTIEPGTYSRIRFHITSATAIANGTEFPAQIPEDVINLVRPFRVEENKTTVIILDFDGLRSLRLTEQDQFVMQPVVRVYSEAPASPYLPASVDTSSQAAVATAEPPENNRATGTAELPGFSQEPLAEDAKDTDAKDTKDARQAPGSAGSAPWPRFDEKTARFIGSTSITLEGKVSAIRQDHWVVSRLIVQFMPNVEISGAPKVGDTVSLEGIRLKNGTVLATKIEVTRVKPGKRGGNKSSSSPAAQAGPPSKPPKPAKPAAP